MKNRFFLSATLIIAFCALIFSGCFLKDDEKDDAAVAVVPAAEVTIDQVQDLKGELGITFTGSGAVVDATTVDTTTGTVVAAQDKIDEAFENLMKQVVKADIKKSIKASMNRKSSKESDSDSGSWNESDTHDLTLSEGFASGKVDYITSGTYSWYWDESVVSGTVVQFIDNGSEAGSDEWTIKNARLSGISVTLNGKVNQNYNVRNNFSQTADTMGTQDQEDDVYKSMSNDFAAVISQRSGYVLTGNYECYFVLSMDFSVAAAKQFTEAELNAEGFNEDAAMKAVAVTSGSMTVKIYDTNGDEFYSKTYTAKEILDNYFD